VVENARAFDTSESRHLNKIRAPLQGANDVWVEIMFQGDFLQKSPFAFTVHTFGVRRFCIMAPRGVEGQAGEAKSILTKF
jgi:hypothetical protein